MNSFFVTTALASLWFSLAPVALSAGTSPAPLRAEAVSNSLLPPDVGRTVDPTEVEKQLSDRRLALDRYVVAQLKQPQVGRAQKASLYRMAAILRLYQAIDLMINDIKFQDVSDGGGQPGAVSPLGVGGPTAENMLPIFGMPAFRELLDVMSDRKPDVPFVAANADAYVAVLWTIEGKRYAVLRLQDRLAREKSPKVQAQYRLVISRLKKYPDANEIESLASPNRVASHTK